jgi:hypothetical protein
MNEEQWLAAADPRPLLEVVRDTASDRRLRLFGCACVRRVWVLLLEEQSRRLVEAGELYADGLADELTLAEARQAYHDHLREADDGERDAEDDEDDLVLPDAEAATAACEVAESGASLFCALYASHYAASAAEGGEQGERAAQAVLLRDIFNPFRPITLSPSCLTPQVVALAQAAYDQRELPSGHLDPAHLAVLADALSDAGCEDAGLLGHLRGGGVHVRGCWGVDAVLGKS